jgi:hypothetical protein
MQREQITIVIEQQQKAGKSFAEIHHLALMAGLSEAVFLPILQQSFPHKSVQTNPSSEKFFWDPLHDHITTKSFAAQKYEANKTFEKLLQTPLAFKKQYKKRLIWGGTGMSVIVAILGFLILPDIMSGDIDSNSLGLFGLSFICFVPAGLTYNHAKKLQKQILYQLVAKENNWIAGPSQNYLRWTRLKHRLPEFFDRGNQNQTITDEFWGNVKSTQNKEQEFYSGIFYFEVQSGHGKNRQISRHSQRFYAFKLNKNHDVKLLITQDDFGKNLLRRIGLRKKDTDVESTLFNKKFETHITNSLNEKLDIFQYLSPIAQDKLVELEKHNTNVTVAVLYDSAFFMNDRAQFNFPGLETSKIYTNFLRKIAVDTRDIATITDQIKRIIPIAHSIVKTWK